MLLAAAHAQHVRIRTCVSHTPLINTTSARHRALLHAKHLHQTLHARHLQQTRHSTPNTCIKNCALASLQAQHLHQKYTDSPSVYLRTHGDSMQSTCKRDVAKHDVTYRLYSHAIYESHKAAPARGTGEGLRELKSVLCTARLGNLPEGSEAMSIQVQCCQLKNTWTL